MMLQTYSAKIKSHKFFQVSIQRFVFIAIKDFISKMDHVYNVVLIVLFVMSSNAKSVMIIIYWMMNLIVNLLSLKIVNLDKVLINKPICANLAAILTQTARNVILLWIHAIFVTPTLPIAPSWTIVSLINAQLINVEINATSMHFINKK